MQGTRLARIAMDARDRLHIRDLIRLLTPHVWDEAGHELEQNQVAQVSSALLSAHAELTIMSRDPERSQVLQQLRLPQFFEDQTMGQMLAVLHSAKNSNALRTDSRFRLFRNFLSSIEAFDNMTNALQTFLIDQRFRRSSEKDHVIQLAFLSRQEEHITLDYLRSVLQTVQRLHDLVARAVGETDSIARLVVIDSGSDILLALEARAKAASAIGSLLKEWWDWFKYRDLHNFDRKMDSWFKGLTVIGELEKATATPGPEAEEAKVLRQQIFDELKTLTGLGVKLSEPEQAAHDRPLLEAKRDVKLLKQPEPQDDSTEAD